jgi:colanic acid biosynthesis glycosyl transferase WcaI
MKIIIHDYPGHAFPVQLSRQLALRGHTVNHLYFQEFQAPHGLLEKLESDADGFEVTAVYLGEPFAKYNLAKRWWQECKYGQILARQVMTMCPDIVISCSTPLNPQAILQHHCKIHKVPFVFWIQDIYSQAIRRFMESGFPIVGTLIGKYYERLEANLLSRSHGIVAITEDFLPFLAAMKIDPNRVTTIRNWAALEEVAPFPKDNDWSREQRLEGKFVFLYAGTLGLKHNPERLAFLARRLSKRPEVRIVVASEGPGAEYLARVRERDHLTNLRVINFQSYSCFPKMLAAADVLIALLEADSAVYSVPSKILNYMCAQRAILGIMPPRNLAARLLQDHQIGVVVIPDDPDGLIMTAECLIDDPLLRNALARNARQYAERTFDITRITSDFERVIQKACTA